MTDTLDEAARHAFAALSFTVSTTIAKAHGIVDMSAC